MEKTRNQPGPTCTRLSNCRDLEGDPSLSPGQQRWFFGRPQSPFEADRVRVPSGMRVVEMVVGDQRYPFGPEDCRNHGTSVDFGLKSAHPLAAGNGVEVLIESLVAASRCVPVLLGQPTDGGGLKCVPLVPIERTSLFEVEEGLVDIETRSGQRGRVARVHFRTDDLHELDLVDLLVGRDSQRVAATTDVPLGLFPEGLDVSCELQPWLPVIFKVRNRGGRKTLAIDVDMTPPAESER